VLNELHIRFATNTQLAELFDTNPNTTARWTSGRHGISTTMLDRAAQKGISTIALIQGLQQRREDAEIAKLYQAELDEFLTRQPVVA
jgi:uncharacterized caspase-like protein